MSFRSRPRVGKPIELREQSLSSNRFVQRFPLSHNTNKSKKLGSVVVATGRGKDTRGPIQ